MSVIDIKNIQIQCNIGPAGNAASPSPASPPPAARAGYPLRERPTGPCGRLLEKPVSFLAPALFGSDNVFCFLELILKITCVLKNRVTMGGGRKEAALAGPLRFAVRAGAKKASDSANRRGAPSVRLARAGASGQSGARFAPPQNARPRARARAQDTRESGSRRSGKRAPGRTERSGTKRDGGTTCRMLRDRTSAKRPRCSNAPLPPAGEAGRRPASAPAEAAGEALETPVTPRGPLPTLYVSGLSSRL